ncbi:MAG: hypothetical protein WBX95_23165 [Xanthobacteraceae bacterium]
MSVPRRWIAPGWRSAPAMLLAAGRAVDIGVAVSIQLSEFKKSTEVEAIRISERSAKDIMRQSGSDRDAAIAFIHAPPWSWNDQAPLPTNSRSDWAVLSPDDASGTEFVPNLGNILRCVRRLDEDFDDRQSLSRERFKIIDLLQFLSRLDDVSRRHAK